MSAGTKLLVGIDEAGYGPNLGPLVVVAVSLEVPDDARSEELWDRLSSAVTRCVTQRRMAADRARTVTERLVVDDSKRVYARGDGLDHLERGTLAWIGFEQELPSSLRGLWQRHCLTPQSDMDDSPWHAERDLPLPQIVSRAALDASLRSLRAALAGAGFARPGIACHIIMPRRFNELIAREHSKSNALFRVNAELLRHVWENSPVSRIEAKLDKHGGRNFYRPLLQQHFTESIVLAGREGVTASRYTLSAGGRQLETTFMPRADANHLLVAWASMTAKYLRELCMRLFNGFWAERVPGLRATAGYPLDARRFWDEIRPTAEQLAIARTTLWRER